jgi:hypothetical protein
VDITTPRTWPGEVRVRHSQLRRDVVRRTIAFGCKGTPGVGAPTECVGLLNIESHLLQTPVQWNRDAASECLCCKVARLPTVDNRFNDIRRQESQTDQAAQGNMPSFAGF